MTENIQDKKETEDRLIQQTVRKIAFFARLLLVRFPAGQFMRMKQRMPLLILTLRLKFMCW